jgi:hypothetical protein
MKIIFFCAMSFDYDNPGSVPDKIKQWNDFHKIDFFKYRKIVTDVAVASWKNTGADVYINPSSWRSPTVGQPFHDLLNLTDEQLHLISQYDYVVPVDDDDLFAPQFVASVEKYAGPNVSLWNCLAFSVLGNVIDSFRFTDNKQYFDNDIGHVRRDLPNPEYASACYGLQTTWLLENPERNVCFFHHGIASALFTNPTIINECLGCKIISGANVSVLNLTTPMQPIYNIKAQWKSHWPMVFCNYFSAIQNNVNKLF